MAGRSRHLLQCCAGLLVKTLFLMDGDAFLCWRFINQLRLPGFPSRTEAELGKALAPGFAALLVPAFPAGCRQQRISPRPDAAHLGATRGDWEQAGRYRGGKIRGMRGGEDAGRKHGMPCAQAGCGIEGTWQQAQLRSRSQWWFPGHVLGGLQAGATAAASKQAS